MAQNLMAQALMGDQQAPGMYGVAPAQAPGGWAPTTNFASGFRPSQNIEDRRGAPIPIELLIAHLMSTMPENQDDGDTPFSAPKLMGQR